MWIVQYRSPVAVAQYKAFLLFVDGLVDSNLINNYILKPLMLKNKANSFIDSKDIIELREYEFRHSDLMSSSKYMKIRSLRNDE